MTDEYETYLRSDAWRNKREERLNIGMRKCSACNAKKKLQVHHLTYERIFNEDMADLMPLCEKCHTIAERLVKTSKISRKGNVLFLASETIRLILTHPVKIKKPHLPYVPEPKLEGTPRQIQSELISDPEFTGAVTSMPREEFKIYIHKKLSGKHSRYLANAFTIYDRFKLKGSMERPPRKPKREYARENFQAEFNCSYPKKELCARMGEPWPPKKGWKHRLRAYLDREIKAAIPSR